MPTLYDNLQILLDKYDKNASQLSKATGITKSSFTHWKKSGFNPNLKHIILIADYFGVSIDEVIGHKVKVSNSVLIDQILGEQQVGNKKWAVDIRTDQDPHMVYRFVVEAQNTKAALIKATLQIPSSLNVEKIEVSEFDVE